MMNHFKSSFIGLCCLLFVVSQAEVKVEGFEVIEYGIYTAEAKEKVEDESTIEGTWTVVDNLKLTAQTDSVLADMKTHFGFWFVVKGEPVGEEITVTFVNQLPGIQNPDEERVIYEEKYNSTVKIGVPSFKGYMFDYSWEAVPGEWIFQIYYENQKLGEKRFVVYK
jgi:hypothetical protein